MLLFISIVGTDSACNSGLYPSSPLNLSYTFDLQSQSIIKFNLEYKTQSVVCTNTGITNYCAMSSASGRQDMYITQDGNYLYTADGGNILQVNLQSFYTVILP